jgi:ribosomal protein S18 acetylase RimI-like enzyme
MQKTMKMFVRFAVLIAVSTALGWCTYQYTQQSCVIDFDYQRDHRALREIFERDWDWLIPVGPDQYSLDLVIKYRAPQQNPLYAGRLVLKVMRDGDKLIGFVGYYMKNDHEGFFNFLDVNPEYRGKGYAETLARYAINDMIHRGARRITIVTYPHNVRALKLYNRLGFREIKRDRQVKLEYLPS